MQDFIVKRLIRRELNRFYRETKVDIRLHYIDFQYKLIQTVIDMIEQENNTPENGFDAFKEIFASIEKQLEDFQAKRKEMSRPLNDKEAKLVKEIKTGLESLKTKLANIERKDHA